MRVRILFFAMCREMTACDSATIELPENADGEHLWDILQSKFPGLKPYRNMSRLAVNQVYVSGPLHLKDGDEVCVIPPVSGG